MSVKLFDLSGKRALVTGSSQGIGFSLAEGLAMAGASVVLNGRSADKVDAAVATIDGASGYAFDITDSDAVAESVSAIERDLGPIDILVNNAGIQHRQPLEEFPLEVWRELMRTNVEGMFIVGQAAARAMIPRGRGKIINIASLQSEAARYSIAPYTASKGAVKNLTKGMCTDWARHGLQVNAIGPGYFETPLNQALIDDPGIRRLAEKAHAGGALGQGRGAARRPAFSLASDASSFVNGQTLYVDGGVLATL